MNGGVAMAKSKSTDVPPEHVAAIAAAIAAYMGVGAPIVSVRPVRAAPERERAVRPVRKPIERGNGRARR